MRVQRTGIIVPGIETVEVDGLGAFNFENGRAELADPEMARKLIDKGVCTDRDSLARAAAEGPVIKAPLGLGIGLTGPASIVDK